MLSKIRFIIWLLIIFVVAFFVSMNSEPKISIKLFPGYQTEPLPLSIVIVGSLIMGAILILIMAITDWLKFKIETVKLKTRVSKLEKELKKCQEERDKLSQELTKLKEENQKQVDDGNKERENIRSN
jgi:uncharacterized integral membrane protein